MPCHFQDSACVGQRACACVNSFCARARGWRGEADGRPGRDTISSTRIKYFEVNINANRLAHPSIGQRQATICLRHQRVLSRYVP